MFRFLPVFTNDPLEWSRPFPEAPQSHFAAHWHEIAYSAIFYFLLQLVSPRISRKIFGKAYSNLNVKAKLNFDIHVVSMFQCIVSLMILIPAWNHPHFQNRQADPYNSIFGYNPYSGFVSAVTSGYFVWDLFVCVKYINLFGPGFLVHAVAALFVFSCALRPYLMPWAPAFLIFELSTPFVNINWFASRLPAGTISDRVISINGILLIVVFFFVRIVWGFYAVSLVARDMYAVLDEDYKILPFIILSLNVALDFLNIVWFMKMLAIAKKKISGAKGENKTLKPRQVASEVSKID